MAAALIVSSPVSRGQTPAPRHDVSGTWTPARGEGDGIGGTGARDFPEDGTPEHQLPYTDVALMTRLNVAAGVLEARRQSGLTWKAIAEALGTGSATVAAKRTRQYTRAGAVLARETAKCPLAE
jgi:hypothetical protein